MRPRSAKSLRKIRAIRDKKKAVNQWLTAPENLLTLEIYFCDKKSFTLSLCTIASLKV
jgi:hypothetical protein